MVEVDDLATVCVGVQSILNGLSIVRNTITLGSELANADEVVHVKGLVLRVTLAENTTSRVEETAILDRGGR
jgi:hypothetical protein